MQGKTKQKIVVDLNKRPSDLNHLTLSGVYVSLSRVHSSEDIRILPPQNSKAFNYLYQLKYPDYVEKWFSGFGEDGKFHRV